jgi:hypothetical protein
MKGVSTHSVSDAKSRLAELIYRGLKDKGGVITRHGRPIGGRTAFLSCYSRTIPTPSNRHLPVGPRHDGPGHGRRRRVHVLIDTGVGVFGRRTATFSSRAFGHSGVPD